MPRRTDTLEHSAHRPMSWFARGRAARWQHVAVQAVEKSAVRPPLSAETLALISNSYPHNANYRVVDGQLRPKCQLSLRRQRIAPLYPQPLTSLLDVGCGLGYFVLEAAQQPACERAMGIDVTRHFIDACQQVADHVGSRAAFAVESLDRLADRCHAWHAPFQTVLVMNTYQYLYFGSSLCASHYTTHQEIFGHLRRLTTGRVIFNNRTEFAALQADVRARDDGRSRHFNTAAIRAAAAEFFHVTEHRPLGRYPLWTLEAR